MKTDKLVACPRLKLISVGFVDSRETGMVLLRYESVGYDSTFNQFGKVTVYLGQYRH
jgi:hypothetical protein